MRFQIRTLLLVAAVIGAGLGIVAWWANAARHQAQIVGQLREKGAVIGYHEPSIPVPNYFEDTLGDTLGWDFFASVAEVRFEADNWMPTKVDDALLLRVGQLKRLETLIVSHAPQVTDAGIAELSSLQEIQILELSQTAMTGEGLKTIGKLTSLRSLNLMANDLHDEDLPQLHNLKQLEELQLDSQRITEQGVQAMVAALPNVQVDWPGPSPFADGNGENPFQ